MSTQGFEDLRISSEVLRLAVQPSTTYWACTGLLLADILTLRVCKPELLDLSKSSANTLSKCPSHCRVLANVAQTSLDAVACTYRG